MPERAWGDFGVIHDKHKLKVMRKLVLFPYHSIESNYAISSLPGIFFLKLILTVKVCSTSYNIISQSVFATFQHASNYFSYCNVILNFQTK